MVLAGETSQIERPATVTINAHGDTVRFHGHKGFNWRTLARLVEQTFVDRAPAYSPVR